MPEPILFTVTALPVAQPRQKQRVVTTAGGAFVANYLPRKDPVHAYKAALMEAASAAYTGPPLEGPLQVALVFVLPRPAYLRWKSKPMPRCFHAARPDIDNLVKSTLDALKGILWRDDTQVAELCCRKVHASGDEPCSASVRVLSLASEPVAGPEEWPLFPEDE